MKIFCLELLFNIRKRGKKCFKSDRPGVKKNFNFLCFQKAVFVTKSFLISDFFRFLTPNSSTPFLNSLLYPGNQSGSWSSHRVSRLWIFYIWSLVTFCFSPCSRLDPGVDFKPVTAKNKLAGYKPGDEITCFVSKVSFHERFSGFTV